MAREIETLRATQAQQARDDAHRNEIRSMEDRFQTALRELQGNKQDPVMAMILQLFGTQQQASQATAQAIKETALAQVQASQDNARLMSERGAQSALTPERMLEILRIAKDQSGNAEMMKGALDMYRNLFGMSQDVLKMQAEMYQGSEPPPWVGLLQSTIDRAGQIAQAWARQRNDAPQAAAAPRRVAPAAAASRPVAPPAVASGPETAQQIRDRLAAEKFGPRNGVTGRPEHAVPPEAVRAEVAAAAAPAVPAAPVATPPPVGAPTVRKARRARKTNGSNGAQSPSEGLAAAPTADIRALADAYDDAAFFEGLEDEVRQLREAAGGMTPEQIAGYIIGAPEYATKKYQKGELKALPPLIELLVTGHVDVVIDRLFPDMDKQTRIQVGDHIRVAMRAQAVGQREAAA